MDIQVKVNIYSYFYICTERFLEVELQSQKTGTFKMLIDTFKLLSKTVIYT